jgi:AraC family transcriptional regulator
MDSDTHFGNNSRHPNDTNPSGGVPAYAHCMANDLSVAAAQLLEAASKARQGDRDAAGAHVAHVVALLHGRPSVAPSAERLRPRREIQVARGGLAAWQARRVTTHIDANIDSRIPVQVLAGLLHFSASHFCRAFKCTFGVSPSTYVVRRRIELAQALMLTTRDSLSSIAQSCGMCDQSHFTNTFYRIVGETPYSWRRTRRAEIDDRARVSEHDVVVAFRRCRPSFLQSEATRTRAASESSVPLQGATPLPRDA